MCGAGTIPIEVGLSHGKNEYVEILKITLELNKTEIQKNILKKIIGLILISISTNILQNVLFKGILPIRIF